MAGKLIKKYDTDFFITTNEIFRDKRLSLKELGLLCQLLSLPNDWDFNIKGLATLHTDNYDSVRTGLLKLEEYGYLTRVQKSAERGKFGSIDYYIYANPNDNEEWLKDKKTRDNSPILENPITVEPILENPITVEPITDKQEQYNNNQYRNNKYNSTSTNKPNLNDVFKSKNHELDGMLLTDKQYDDINELVKMVGCNVINSSKDDLLRFLKKLYNKDKQTFTINGIEEIYDLKSFVKGVFSRKTEHDIEEYKQIKNLADQGFDWAINFVDENPKKFSNLK